MKPSCLAAAVLLLVACGRTDKNDAGHDPTPGLSGGPAAGGGSSSGGGAAAPSAVSGAPPAMGGMPQVAGASGEGGLATAGAGGAAGPLVETVIETFVISDDVQVDAQNFYFASQPVFGPPDIMRVSRSGGIAEILVNDVDGTRPDVQLHDGVLYYRTAAEVHAYELATGEDVVLWTKPGNEQTTSMRAGPSGVFWTINGGVLYRYGFDSKAVDKFDATNGVELVLGVEAEQVIIRGVYPVGGPSINSFDLANRVPLPLSDVGSYSFSGPFTAVPADEDWFYRLESLQPGQTGQTDLQRVPRHGIPPAGQHYPVPEVLTSWDLVARSQPFLFEGKLLLKMSDDLWYAISTVDMSRRTLPLLSPCRFLFSEGSELFCGTTGNVLYRISPEALGG